MASARGRAVDPEHVDLTSGEIAELRALVPQLSAYFRRARSEMPPGMREDFEKYGLGPRHGAVLTQLLADSPSTISELASRLGVSLPSVSEVVADLVSSDWVLRAADPMNRRRTLLSLNPRHKRQLTRYADVRTAPLVGALRRLSFAQRAGFMAGLREWVREANTG